MELIVAVVILGFLWLHFCEAWVIDGLRERIKKLERHAAEGRE